MDDADGRVEQAATRIGSVIDGRWSIESLLGVGGMAAVYAASSGEHRGAIKVLHPDLVRSQLALDRFRREREAMRIAQHPAVPRVHGEGKTADGCPYLVMDLLLGESVESRRRRFGGRLAAAEVVRIALVVLDVLDVVHRRGVLHRDVKPSNILWLDDGSIRLIDFGIARMSLTGEDAAFTRTGTLPGSLAFMSPEHAIGVPSEIDARTDLWSLGATMFLLLSGRPVHEGQTDVEALALSATRKPRSLASVVEHPPALVAVVDRALAFDRSRRFSDAAEMHRALSALSPTGAGTNRPVKWRRVALPVALLGTIGVLGLALARSGPSSPTVSSSATASAAARERPTSSTGAPGVAEPAAEPSVASPPPHPRTSHHLEHDAASLPPPSGVPPISSPACDPPYVIDPATGTRRVKPGC